MVKGEVVDFIRNVPMSNHIVLFYETPQEKYDIIMPFVKAGLENQQSVIYITDDECPRDFLSRLSQIGVGEKTKGLRVLDGEGFCSEFGDLERNRFVDRCMEVADDAISRGYTGLRVTGEPAFFFKDNHLESWMDHERSFPKRFDFPMTSVCRYNLKDLRSYKDGSLLPELIRIHSYTITPTFAEEVDFQECYLRSVEEALNSLLGRPSASVILNYLESQCRLPRKEIPGKMEDFEKELKDIFGTAISAMVYEYVLKDLYAKLGLRYK